MRNVVGFRAAQGGVGPGDHRLLAEQDRGVLDEHAVRVLVEVRPASAIACS